VNAPIARLFGVVILLFALLVLFTSRWTVFEASSLNNNTLNVRTLLDELKIKRGRILAADGTVLAKSVPAPPGAGRTRPGGCSPSRSDSRSPPRARRSDSRTPPARICAAFRPG
jgi:hypothetical protein